MFDEDMKIVGEETANDITLKIQIPTDDANASKLAKEIGIRVAEKTVASASLDWGNQENDSFDLGLQRGLLLAFGATVTLEGLELSERIKDVIKRVFLETLSSLDASLYKETTQSGAFSFYYLAYRRGIEVERRIGQTFAMLCAHDGDPVYQELGEALYCSAVSKTSKTVKESGIYDIKY